MMISTFKWTQYTYNNQFKPYGLSNPYQKDEHISKFRSGGIFRFSPHFDRTFCTANSGDPDQMQVWHLIWFCTVCPRRPTKDVGITDFNLSIILAHKFNDVTAKEFTWFFSVGQLEIQSKKGDYENTDKIKLYKYM